MFPQVETIFLLSCYHTELNFNSSSFISIPIEAVPHWVTAQTPNATTQMKNATTSNKPTTKMVVNMSDHTIKVINMINNQTISVKNFTMEKDETPNLTNNTSPR
jgi:hypothetical protein